ncbi:type IV pilin protein [Microbulbifer sp.]|uniref:type IV pilin protein n=1 Tax=Microbulbifer sp. TaxID=1908541 RepID=UPI00258C0084|nr:type IV pilin protein [Microbulbifer sp.]
MKKQYGFTLIEMMIVVAIMGIIAAIAYPSYMESVRKSNRADAKASLNDTAQRLQRCFTTYNAYNNENCTVAETLKNGTITSGEGMYTISFDSSAADSFKLKAAPVAGTSQAGDTKCATFTLTNTGVEDVSGTSPADYCW